MKEILREYCDCHFEEKESALKVGPIFRFNNFYYDISGQNKLFCWSASQKSKKKI